MIQLIQTLLRAVRSFRVVDFVVLKICLLAIGVLLGVYFNPFFVGFLMSVWIIAVLAMIWLIVRIIDVLKKK